jgi:hypothetical protein
MYNSYVYVCMYIYTSLAFCLLLVLAAVESKNLHMLQDGKPKHHMTMIRRWSPCTTGNLPIRWSVCYWRRELVACTKTRDYDQWMLARQPRHWHMFRMKHAAVVTLMRALTARTNYLASWLHGH